MAATDEIFKLLDFIADNFDYYVVFMVSMTLIVLVLTTRYAMGNIFTIWQKGAPVPAKECDSAETDDEIDGIVKSSEVDWSPQEGPEGPDSLPSGDAGPDPVQFCEHLQSEVKKARQRVATREITNNLTKDDVENEREIQRKQLEQIFKLMEQQEEKFGVATVDDIHQQMKLYA